MFSAAAEAEVEIDAIGDRLDELLSSASPSSSHHPLAQLCALSSPLTALTNPTFFQLPCSLYPCLLDAFKLRLRATTPSVPP